MVSKAEQAISDFNDDEKKTNDKTQERYTFDFSYTVQRGHTYSGTFTNRILSFGDESDAHVIAARMRGGMAIESLDPEIANLQNMIGLMEVSLDQKGRPPWATNLATVKDKEAIIMLYAEVSSHEEIFRGPKKNQEKNERGGSKSEGNE